MLRLKERDVVSGLPGLKPRMPRAINLAPLLLLILTGFCSASTLSGRNLDFLGRGGGTVGLVARVGSPDNLYWNSSGLAFGGGNYAFAGYMDYLVGVRGGTLGYTGKGSGCCGYGVWVSYLSSGSLIQTDFDDPTGGMGETFKHTEVMAGLAGGTDLLPYLSVGAALKLARQDLDDFSTSGLFGDLSTTLKVYSPDPRTSSYPAVYTSYIARNIMLTRWGDEEGSLSGNSEVGAALEFPGGDLVVGCSFYFAERGRREVRSGIEARLSEDFELRVGYRRRTGLMSDQANDLPWERGLMAGFGVVKSFLSSRDWPLRIRGPRELLTVLVTKAIQTGPPDDKAGSDAYGCSHTGASVEVWRGGENERIKISAACGSLSPAAHGGDGSYLYHSEYHGWDCGERFPRTGRHDLGNR